MQLVGTTVRDTIAALSGGRGHFGSEEQAQPKGHPNAKANAIVLVLISFVAIFIGTYLVVLNEGTSQALGGGILGTVFGYWFR